MNSSTSNALAAVGIGIIGTVASIASGFLSMKAVSAYGEELEQEKDFDDNTIDGEVIENEEDSQ